MSSSARCRQSRRQGWEQKGQEVGRESGMQSGSREGLFLKRQSHSACIHAGGIAGCKRKERCGGERVAEGRGSG